MYNATSAQTLDGTFESLEVTGEWQVKVKDGASGDDGTLYQACVGFLGECSFDTKIANSSNSATFKCSGGCEISTDFVDDNECDCPNCDDESEWTCASCPACNECSEYIHCIGDSSKPYAEYII